MELVARQGAGAGASAIISVMNKNISHFYFGNQPFFPHFCLQKIRVALFPFRILAKRFPDAEVTGITLSPEQAQRAGRLAEEQGLKNVRFQVMDALNMEHPGGQKNSTASTSLDNRDVFLVV